MPKLCHAQCIWDALIRQGVPKGGSRGLKNALARFITELLQILGSKNHLVPKISQTSREYPIAYWYSGVCLI